MPGGCRRRVSRAATSSSNKVRRPRGQGSIMLRNTAATWGWGAKALHWIGALAILLLLGHGWWMTHMTPRGPDRLAHYAGHAALGYDFLVLLVLRLLWRWTNAVPDLPPDTKPWERFAAHAGHVGLYVLMFAVVGTGWAV